MTIDPKVAQFITPLIREYYEKVPIDIERLNEREFGFGSYETKINTRHHAFNNKEQLKEYLVANAPPFVSCSPSFYEKPAARPMEKKIWKGAELVFDLDSTDLNLACQKVHGSSWVCDNCFNAVKDETLKLIEDFLIPDFGFSESELKLSFSGNRGYHIHVVSDAVMELNSKERKEMSDYISGNNINIESFFPNINVRGKRLDGPKPSDYGWGGKIARSVISALNSGESALEEFGIEKKEARKLIKNKTNVTFGITTGNWDKVKIPKKAEFWNNVIKNLTIKQGDSIDKNVTNDTSHILRMPNTLHGDTGLIARKISSISRLEKFDPMKDAVAFSSKPVKIHAINSPELSMKGKTYGPYKNEDVEIEMYAAIYLMLKRVAVLAE